MQKLFKPKVIKKEERPGGGLQWDWQMRQMVLEMLSHRTPPTCIAPNILTVAEMICPSIVHELPGVSFMRGCRSELAFFTKLCATYELGWADTYLEHHSDGTQRRQISMQNSIIRIAVEGGFRSVTLSSAILSEDETSEVLTDAILRTFREGRGILKVWREVTAREYPNRQDLLDLIPKPHQLTLSKLANGGWVMTDTCNPARKFRRLFVAAIKEIAKEEGMSEEDIHIFEAGEY